MTRNDDAVRDIELSVVIPTHDNLETLKRCLASWKLVRDVSCELIVIEDGCSDGTAEWLATVGDGERIRHFHEDDVYETLSDIRGMQEAKGRYVLIWQDDMFIRHPWFITEALATVERWPELAVLGLMLGKRYKPLRYRPQSQAQFYDPVHGGDTIWGGLFKAHEVDGCVRPWIVRKACIESQGVLDKAFAPLHWDEIDYHFRLRAGGWKVAVLSYKVLGGYTHQGGSTTSKLGVSWLENLYVKNGLRFYERWSDFIEKTHRRRFKSWKRVSSFAVPRGWFKCMRFLLWCRVMEPLYPIWRPLHFIYCSLRRRRTTGPSARKAL